VLTGRLRADVEGKVRKGNRKRRGGEISRYRVSKES